MTSNLLFGISSFGSVNGWVPVHRVRRGRIKLLLGSLSSIKGKNNRVPNRLNRYGLGSVFRDGTMASILDLRHACAVISTFRIRCHSRTARRRMTATKAIFFFFGLRKTNRWYRSLAWSSCAM